MGKNGKNKNLVRASAFRAVNVTTPQPVPANSPIKVIFPTQQFDLAGEYNPNSSTFIPENDGVYLILASVGFAPANPNLDYRARIEIRVNGNPAVAIDNDFFGGGTPFVNSVQVSTILNLKENDVVEVFAQSNIAGTIDTGEDGSRFEAARFPSPLRKDDDKEDDD
ncbi:ABC transporter permease [Robertmurraya beringensis]|uniref:ABC transporter permease n=1 Tax=Robertmurraya beringensis TaxID=641660 RepID=A0ABV6KSH3_9BACI